MDGDKRKSDGGSSGKNGKRKGSTASKLDADKSLSSTKKRISQLSDPKSEGGYSSTKSQDEPMSKLFRVTNADVSSAIPKRRQSDKASESSRDDRSSRKPGFGTEDESEQSSFGQGEIEFVGESEGEDTYVLESGSKDFDTEHLYDEYEDMDDEEEIERIDRSRSIVLKDMWLDISHSIRKIFDSPCRVFKLRGYHSEPDLSLPFEDKFDLKFHPPKRDGQKKLIGKSVSYEDIVCATGKEHPDLVRGVLSEFKLRSYAIDEKMENSWREIFELEKKRFSFFDELFAMGYVVDSLEVLSSPPKGEDGKPVTPGEYFVEAEEKHYRKKVDYGRVVFKTKHVYTGNFQDWYFQGPGRYCWQDGTIYQGEFNQGLMHGPGSIHWPDGCIYEGHFIDGIRTGWGVYSSADGHTFAGEWFEGLPHGHGKMWYDPEDDDNDYYEGQWEKGLPQGIGTRQYATGDRYVGNWERGMRNGYGIMIWLQERQVYKGGWLDGVPQGLGKHIWYLERTPTNSFPTRHVYQGAWVLGRREGIGKMIYPCGSVYEGRWKNGQRHGKGMFINPAGDILVGLFRAGSIIGGSQVPLHAPTYECDFGGLSDWLTARFSLSFTERETEGTLLEITKRYLPFLRKLYHRAGEFSQKYGNHGLYPAYMKKGKGHEHSDHSAHKPWHHHHSPPDLSHDTTYNIHHHREYSRLDEAEHMKGKLEKPESLDGINPVTRFGLWLLLRDCEGLLDEVTMAYYDKIWCETPPISFQTRHNPFEPVYLWQFLEALVATAVAYYIDIPRQRQHEHEKGRLTSEDVGVSDTTVNAGISYEEHKRQLIARRNRARSGKLSGLTTLTTVTTTTVAAVKAKSSHRKRKESTGVFPSTEEVKDKSQQLLQKGKKANLEIPLPGDKQKTSNTQSKGGPQNTITNENIKVENTGPVKDLRKSRKSRGKSVLHDGTLGSLFSGDNLSAKDNNNESEDEVSSLEFNEEENESTEEVDEEVETEAASRTPSSIPECFEMFIQEKLLPCIRRDAGENLPVVPQPLPALVDMYEAFKGIKNRDILKGTEFLRSTLPHLLFPNPKDAIWWHRCPESLSLDVNLTALFNTVHEKFPEISEDQTENEENWEDKLESEYLGVQAQNSETTLRLLHICNGETNEEGCVQEITPVGHQPPLLQQEITNMENMEPEDLELMSEFMQEGHAFAEEELVPEPFLWADDYKCIPVPRKYQHFVNISAQDVIDVLGKLYPNLCQGQHENDLHFELIFCDWLWCTSLLAKTSTEREFRDAWKTQLEKPRPLTNPQSLGVFAHYTKQIQNNPYLSLDPPRDFVPKKKEKAENSEERRAVKFSSR